MFSVEEKALLAVGVVSAGFVFIFLVTLLILYFSTLKAVKSIVSGSRRDELRMLESKGSGGRSDSGDDKISSSQSDLLYLEFVDRRRCRRYHYDTAWLHLLAQFCNTVQLGNRCIYAGIESVKRCSAMGPPTLVETPTQTTLLDSRIYRGCDDCSRAELVALGRL
ncbi:hypothetical protein PPL_11473 [Heterostelium album PN500]|uniref:Uncharacterized protein n=1 Tax=Heterostelium pallidum (strain ATCC 26659 / Pp 5 / PN500) TaxID=670386 RepID=D3BTH7_HETP5|nr:hypothetical protein PPL_11473 [Heterostelium album PN500]EFA75394.1 hypothetical protein PPL_11473 [Heterostelium album PN500]|eukprot:XP_020427528.1 hypothetical protein PPL_11473 [Heterostelium album PN500]